MPRRSTATYWPILLEQRLPVIPVPLKEGDDDALLDLQQVLTESYRRGRYHLRIDYTKPPVPPLSPERMAWAQSLAAVPK
jgi:hypothetical protein